MVPVTDITREIVAKQLGETTAAEDALARAHEFLADALRAKAQLMTQMGHEIRTPLNGIVGTTELLLGTSLSDEQREYASATMTSATALTVVINDVLDFSMLEAGTLELGVGTFEIRHLVDGLALAAPASQRLGGAAITTEFADEIPGAVCGDGHRIRRVLTKLVASALSHSDNDALILRVSATSHSAKRLMLRFEVIDRGSDFADQSLESLFDIYSYAQGTTAQQDRSAGIGLTVCKQLVELMGGDIGVEHTPGDGTAFWFTTPVGVDGTIPYPQDRVRATPRAARAPVSTHLAPPRPHETPVHGTVGRPRLLIADDDPVSRLVLTRQLEARGYLVDVATNGREALDLHANGTYGAIFMDCQMPELNGFDATGSIREREADSAHTPIIAMTASVREADREQCFVSGMDDYVAKPLDQPTLDAALARRIPTYYDGEPAPANGNGERAEAAEPATVPLLENSLLTDVFRHNVESRAYLIGVFIDESRTRIEQLAAAEAIGDSATMQRLSHALKGSARAVGARRLEQICDTVQGDATEGRISEATELQATLTRCFELTAELLRKGCPGS